MKIIGLGGNSILNISTEYYLFFHVDAQFIWKNDQINRGSYICSLKWIQLITLPYLILQCHSYFLCEDKSFCSFLRGDWIKPKVFCMLTTCSTTELIPALQANYLEGFSHLWQPSYWLTDKWVQSPGDFTYQELKMGIVCCYCCNIIITATTHVMQAGTNQ